MSTLSRVQRLKAFRRATVLKAVLGAFLAFWTLFVEVDVLGQDFERGLRNYYAIIQGEKAYESLSETEKAEVLMVIQLLRSPPDDASSDCRDAWNDAESAASDLQSYAKRLMQCAASGDFRDDCYSEFRRVKNAHDEYESASSDVQSYCD